MCNVLLEVQLFIIEPDRYDLMGHDPVNPHSGLSVLR